MPVTHTSVVFAVKDAKISPMTADVAGSAPTYGAAIDVPGIKSVTVSGDIITSTLRGDFANLAARSALGDVTVEFEHGKLSLDALAAMTGATVTDTGVTPNQVATWGLNGDENFPPFRFQGVSAGADPIAGDVLLVLNKVTLSSFPDLGFEEDDFRTFTVEGTAVKPTGTGRLIEKSIRETAAPLT